MKFIISYLLKSGGEIFELEKEEIVRSYARDKLKTILPSRSGGLEKLEIFTIETTRYK